MNTRSLFIAGILAFVCTAVGSALSNEPPTDPRFILQTQAGLAAYAQITGTISITYIRPIYFKVDAQTDSYIIGDYQPSMRTLNEVVKLMVHRNGWAVAYHPRGQNVSQFFDCPAYNINIPAYMPNRLETSLNEVAAALGVTTTVQAFYDFSNPRDDHIILQWLYQPNIGQISATMTPPLANSYHERGFCMCTITYYSELLVNSELIAKGNLTFIYGLLRENQLLPGHVNTIAANQPPVFWFQQGMIGGVAMMYEGDAPMETSGGYRRDIALSYPSMLGEPLTISMAYLPLMEQR